MAAAGRSPGRGEAYVQKAPVKAMSVPLVEPEWVIVLCWRLQSWIGFSSERNSNAQAEQLVAAAWPPSECRQEISRR